MTQQAFAAKQPLTPAQLDIYLHQQRYPDSPFYIIGGYYQLKGHLRLPLLKAAALGIVNREAAFRTRLDIKGDTPLQYYTDEPLQDIPVLDYTGEQAPLDHALTTLRQDFGIPFSLTDQLFRLSLVRLSDTNQLIYIKAHHLILDGWGFTLFLRQLLADYECLSGGFLPQAGAFDFRHAVAAINTQQENATAFLPHQRYWSQKFSPLPPQILYPISEHSSLKSRRHQLALPYEQYQQLLLLANDNGVSIFHVLLGLLYVYFTRACQTDELVIGLPVHNRTNARFKKVLGVFASTAAARFNYGTSLSFKDLLREIRQAQKQDYRYQDYPLGQLYRDLQLLAHNREQLFDITFSFEQFDYNISAVDVEEILPRTFTHEHDTQPFNLFVRAYRTNEPVLFDFQLREDHFTDQDGENMLRRFSHLLTYLPLHSDQRIGEMNWLPQEELQTLGCYDTPIVPATPLFLSQWEEQSLLQAHKTALITADEQLSYHTLQAKVTQLANWLHLQGAGKDIPIAVCLNRSSSLMITLLAIWKAGSAYIPLDPEYPEERINMIITDAACGLAITEAAFSHKFASTSTTAWLYEEILTAPVNPITLPAVAPDSLAYIIYTSGSTGRPKGVAIEHHTVANFLAAMASQPGLLPTDILLAVTTVCFDIHVLELFLPLYAGATVVLASATTTRDAFALQALLSTHSINIMQATPATWKMLFLAGWQPDNTFKALCGGEALPGSLAKQFHAHPSISLYNMYGPTEATVWVAARQITPDQQEISIGQPIPGVSWYILDRYGYPAASGTPGELYIGGACLAREYYQLPERTATSFRVHTGIAAGSRLYASGDHVIRKQDGDYYFRQRIDEQVKIRGFRIEQGEVIAAIIAHPDVKDATVKAWKDEQDDYYLVAYCVLHDTATLDEVALLEFLSHTLPHYMLPTVCCWLHTLPLTPNGKVDKKALPAPAGQPAVAQYITPAGEYEIQLANIWSEILGIPQISATANYFSLGGHSINNIRLVNTARTRGIPMEVTDIFVHPTIRTLALVLQARQHTTPYVNELPPAPAAAWYPVPPAAAQLYIQQTFEPDTIAYNMAGAFRIQGHLDIHRLNKAFCLLLQRQQQLRASFFLEDNTVCQHITFMTAFHTEERPWTAGLPVNNTSLKAHFHAFIRPFDLSNPPLLRAALTELPDHTQLLLLDIHHIIADGWSVNICLQELLQLYAGTTLPDPERQYTDYAVWHHQADHTTAYWQELFSSGIPVLQLPLDFPRPALLSHEGDSHYLILDKDITAGIKLLAANHQVSAFTVMLTAYNILLHRYSGQEEMVIGIPMVNRPYQSLQTVMGMFVNTLPVRATPQADKSALDLLQEVHHALAAAAAHSHSPVHNLPELLGLPRDISRHPLFDVLLAWQQSPFEIPSTTAYQISQLSLTAPTSKYDLTLEATDHDQEIHLRFEYNTQLFLPQTITRMASHLQHILLAMTQSVTQPICRINLLSHAEQHRLLYTLNDTSADFPHTQTLHGIFEQQVAATPDHIAVIFREQQLTYTTIAQHANALALQLVQAGVKPGDIVAIVADRSAALSIGILAILKAGAAYLPVSPAYPSDRIQYMLEDSKATVLLTEHAHQHKIVFNSTTLLLDDALQQQAATGPDISVSAASLAYVIYTSGSTGKPKGAMISHRAAVNRIWWMQQQYPLSSHDVILQKTPYTFDVSVWELFWWAFAGASVCFLEPDGEKDPATIMNAVARYQVTTLHFVPSMLQVSLEFLKAYPGKWNLHSLKRVFASGEALQPQQVDSFRECLQKPYGATLHNLYGPTEAAIDVTWFDCPDTPAAASIPIGKPISNIRLYILDSNGNLQPEGIPGELYISGTGVGEGYLNRPDLTAEKFLPDPFFPGQRMYRTGDLTRWCPDGNIAYLGRIDHQVKIRGYRIEPGEIAQQLLKVSGITEAIVTAWTAPAAQPLLCAYYVATRNIDEQHLRDQLSQELPEYMIPAHFIRIDRVPLSPNGKADLKALPIPAPDHNNSITITAPANEVEVSLLHIWKEVLHTDQIGTTHPFFTLGGDSIKAIQVAAKAALHGIEVSVKDIFRYPSIRQLATVATILPTSRNTRYTPLLQHPSTGTYGLSPMQSGILFHDMTLHATGAYHVQMILHLDSSMQSALLENCYRILIHTHDILRTTFRHQGLIQPRQDVQADIVPHFYFRDISDDNTATQQATLKEILQADMLAPYDLATGPLHRMYLLHTAPEQCSLIFSFHHIILDGWSLIMLLQDLLKTYHHLSAGNAALSVRPQQFSSYLRWLDSQSRQSALDYWTGYLSHYSQRTTVNRLKKQHGTYQVQEQQHTIPAVIYDGLKTLAQQQQVTVNNILQAAWGILLQRHNNTDDVVYGAVRSNRPWTIPQIDTIAGIFINTLPVRIQCTPDTLFSELVQAVQTHALSADQYAYLPLADIQQCSELKQGLIDHILVFENYPVDQGLLRQHSTAGQQLKIREAIFNEQTHYDLNVIIVPQQELRIRFNYNQSVYHDTQIVHLAAGLEEILRCITTQAATLIKDISVISPAEQSQLDTFNATTILHQQPSVLHTWFDQQVVRCPTAPAVFHSGSHTDYLTLQYQADKIAAAILHKGISRQQSVALIADRSATFIAAALGILKAGATIVPIDKHYPTERIQYILDDSAAAICLVDEYLPFTPTTPQLTISAALTADMNNINYPDSQPQDLLYIIYTSGTTGQPKGVMLEHRNMANLIAHQQLKGLISDTSRVLQFTTHCFDVYYQEIFTTLLSGGCLYIINETDKRDIPTLFNYIDTHQLPTIFLPTAYLKFLFGQPIYVQQIPACIRHIITAGEQLTVSPLLDDYLRQGKATLHNHYGPSETHVATTYECTADTAHTEVPPIGKPLINNRIYILDKYQRPQPIGAIGEIYIAGANVGRGYAGNMTLTNDRFLADPFFPQERMYRTGDLGYHLPDGNISYAGRIDHQLKIRGYRVEPGEIEVRLLQYPEINAAAVVPHDGPQQDKYLAAYFSASSILPDALVKDWLAATLPDYMIPAVLMQLPAIPLTSNGKVDRKALPAPGQLQQDSAILAATTDTEIRLTDIWQEILGQNSFGITQDFFSLGGHSLKAALLVAHIQKVFQVQLPLQEIFKLRNIQAIGAAIDKCTTALAYLPIQPAPTAEYYRLSAAQKRLFVLSQIEGPNTAYNVPFLARISGEIDISRLEQALNQLIQRHEALRTAFMMIAGTPAQVILPTGYCTMELLSAASVDGISEAMSWVKPFDLSQAPLIRAAWITCPGNTPPLFVVDMHHIITDGVSMEMLLKELWQLYDQVGLHIPQLQYKDYAAWQLENHGTPAWQQQRDYWLRILPPDNIPVLSLPEDSPRPATQSFEGAEYFLPVPAHLVQAMQQQAAIQGVTPFMFTLAVCYLLLHKYSGQEDILIGTPVAGRSHADIQQMAGLFVNTIILRGKPVAAVTFATFLQQIREAVIQGTAHQDFQFEELLEHLQIPRDLSRNPLFDVMFSYLQVASLQLNTAAYNISPVIFPADKAKFDLAFSIQEQPDCCMLSINYATALYHKDTIARMAAHYCHLLAVVLNDIHLPIAAIPLVTTTEVNTILTMFNDTGMSYPVATIQETFEQQVAKTPDAIAVVFRDITTSYTGLNRQANQLARYLAEQGAIPGQHIGIMMERCADTIIAILAILKTGAAYVPLVPELPGDRLLSMLNDADIRIVLSTQQAMQIHDGSRLTDNRLFLSNDQWHKHLNRFDAQDFSTPLSAPEQLAYIIYTSGSTGVPKGVMIEHKSVLNLATWFNRQHDLQTNNRVLQMTSIGFDVSVEEIIVPLLNGAGIYILEDADKLDKQQFSSFLQHHAINIAEIVPTLLYDFIVDNQPFESLRTIITGAEKLDATLKNQVLDKGYQLYNIYGPTETTVNATAKRCTKEDDTIGLPMANTRIYILDQHNNLLPVGIPGELCVAGHSLARGYLNNPEQTNARFVGDPCFPDQRMYRTGDLACWTPEGEIRFLGRIDQQVKIRGYRIELGEITTRLAELPDIKEVVVLAQQDKNNSTYLCAWFTAHTTCSAATLRTLLSKDLPEYMLPAFFVQLDSIPMTLNGKTDYKKLPSPDKVLHSTTPYEPPANETEATLLSIWQQVLSQQQISVLDNFFEIGGHSMKAIAVMSHLHQHIPAGITLAALFRFPTIRTLAKEIDSFTETTFSAITTLTPVRAHHLFAFPPAMGQAMAYSALATHITSHTLHSFNYIDQEDRIAQYVKLIKMMQPRSPYLLMGYSAGGNLAFEVAKALQEEGEIISDIIMIDAIRRVHKMGSAGTDKATVKDEILSALAQNQLTNTSPGYIEKLVDDSYAYTAYVDELVNEGCIHANIHVITAEDVQTYHWENATTGMVNTIRGMGPHIEMLGNPAYLPHNAAIINTLLTTR